MKPHPDTAEHQEEPVQVKCLDLLLVPWVLSPVPPGQAQPQVQPCPAAWVLAGTGGCAVTVGDKGEHPSSTIPSIYQHESDHECRLHVVTPQLNLY